MMNEQEQRIAIAEATGRYERDDNGTGVHWHDRECGYDVLYENELPDYLHNLNAMHEAEETQVEPWDTDKFASILMSIVGAYWHKSGKDTRAFTECSWYYAIAHATAAQRAEAFLRTIGKWKGTT